MKSPRNGVASLRWEHHFTATVITKQMIVEDTNTHLANETDHFL